MNVWTIAVTCRARLSARAIARAALLTLATLLGFVHPPANAMEGGQSLYLKGHRDFMTGVLPPPGVQVRSDMYMYSGHERSVVPQGRLGVDLHAVATILSSTFITPYQILGGRYAFGVRSAVSRIDVSRALVTPGPTLVRRQNLTARNDIVVSPLIIGWQSGLLHWNISTQVWLPAGNYSATRLANSGRNIWAVSPQIGATYFDPRTGWEISGAAIYVVNFENPDTNYRSGDMFHVDFAIGRRLTPHVELGLVGYVAEQLTADSGAGAIFGPRKLRIAGLGPGATYRFAVNGVAVSLVAKYYREFAARNTTQGDAGSLSLRIKF
jgi:hypothetical protein